MMTAIETMSPVESDLFIGESRYPVLVALRAQLTHKLVDVFQAVGLEIDFGWKAREDAGEVQRLLTGGTAPATEAMPLPALHAALLRQRANVDAALALAEQSRRRVEIRNREASLAAAREEIDALERRRALLGVELAAVNRRRRDLREKLGLASWDGPFWTDRFRELDSVSDIVGDLTQHALTSRLVSRKDVDNAGI